MLDTLPGVQHVACLTRLADSRVVGRELFIGLWLVSARVPGEPTQTLPGGQSRVQRLVGQTVEVQVSRPGDRVVMEYPDGRVPEVHGAFHLDTWLEEELLGLQALGVYRRA